MYLSDNNKYVGSESIEKLGMYMIPGCTNSSGCGTEVMDQIKTYCKNFEVKTKSGGLDYQIIGTANDYIKCRICITQKGLKPNSYKDCPIKPNISPCLGL